MLLTFKPTAAIGADNALVVSAGEKAKVVQISLSVLFPFGPLTV